jgi:hypothetical protein
MSEELRPVLEQQSERSTRSRQIATETDLEVILRDPEHPEYQDLRDRAAYVLVTGSYPTHLRNLMNSLLRKLTRYSRQPVSLDGRIGSMRLDQEAIERLDLEAHPMVRKTKEFLGKGYRIQVAKDLRARRPFSRIKLLHPVTKDQIIVQADGSIREGWV